MLELNKSFIDVISNCLWFENCGKRDDKKIEFEVIFVENAEEVKKSISNNKWENLCLIKSGDLTEFLSINYRNEDRKWNELVEKVKAEYMSVFLPEIEGKLDDTGLDKSVLKYIEWDILMLFMSNYYSDYYEDEFYVKLLKIYLSGHLPCGWSGKLKSGIFKVY